MQDLRKRLYELAFKKNMVGQPVSTAYMMLDEYIQKLNDARRAKSEPGYLSCMCVPIPLLPFTCACFTSLFSLLLLFPR